MTASEAIDREGEANPGGRPGGWAWRTLVLDLAPVAVLALLTLAAEERPGVTQLTLTAVVLPLAVRRLWPLPVLAVVALGAVLSSIATSEPWVQVGAIALASFTFGERASERTRSALTILLVAGLMSLGFVAADADTLEATVFTFVIVVPSWLIGDIVRTRRVESARRSEAIERSVREREERLRADAAEERRHVARELHDVVAHAVSVMVIQAGAARQVMRSSPAEAEEALLAVESTGREAMTELRVFLGALSEEEDAESAGLAPQPGIGELSTLLERVREAGLPATLEVDGEPRAVPASLDVTVFRIVQEALTNALRYAERAATLVHLSWGAGHLLVEVLDDGPAMVPPNAAGRGLVGMRERASLVGGRVEAGPRVGGGYAVRAWLPLESGASPSPGTP